MITGTGWVMRKASTTMLPDCQQVLRCNGFAAQRDIGMRWLNTDSLSLASRYPAS